MIVTATFNPSIDYLIKSDYIKMGGLNRTLKEEFVIGGKGINVSLMLNNLKIKSTAIGFVSGFTGDYIRHELKKYEYINEAFLKINSKENTRINIKLKANDQETEINAKGCFVSNSDFNKLKDQLLKLNCDDIFVLSGSLANGLCSSTYYELAEISFINNVKLIVDSTKKNLLQTLEFKPFLIKPNINELMELFNVEIINDDEVVQYAKKLQIMGAKNILVSMGEKGAILVTKHNTYKAKPVKINPVSTVGAGDSMVAGFIASYQKDKDYINALKMASACALSTALNSSVGNVELVHKYLDIIEVEEI